MLRRTPAKDDGFSLIELVITVAILGVVVAALIGVVFGYLRVSNETSTRLNESTDQQFVSTYWQQDVSSLGIHGVPTAGVVPNDQSVWLGSAPGCSPAAGSSTVIMFTWNDYKDAPTDDPTATWSSANQNYATYYTKSTTNANGTTQTQLRRKRCGDIATDTVVARHLVSDPVVNCYKKDGTAAVCTDSSPFPATVSITMTVQDKSEAVRTSTGYKDLTLTGHRRQG